MLLNKLLFFCSVQLNADSILPDINECQLGTDLCVNAECNNTAGSYTCTCLPGFIPQNLTSCSKLHLCAYSYLTRCYRCMLGVKSYHTYVFFNYSPACTNGDIRLMNGTEPSVREGRVEICYNNVYGSICDDFWDIVDASVVCRQLELNRSEGDGILILCCSRQLC